MVPKYMILFLLIAELCLTLNAILLHSNSLSDEEVLKRLFQRAAKEPVLRIKKRNVSSNSNFEEGRILAIAGKYKN